MTHSEERFWSLWARRLQDGTFARVGSRVLAERGGRRVLGGAPVLLVVAVEDNAGPYWGWIPRGATGPCRVGHGQDAYRAQFPHGHTPEKDAADLQGRTVRLRILAVTGHQKARPTYRRRVTAGEACG